MNSLFMTGCLGVSKKLQRYNGGRSLGEWSDLVVGVSERDCTGLRYVEV